LAANNVVDFKTSTGEVLTIRASSIEIIGERNSYPFFRTQSGFEHLLEKSPSAQVLRRIWLNALERDAMGKFSRETTIDIDADEPVLSRKMLDV
jgi:hypothetical protein